MTQPPGWGAPTPPPEVPPTAPAATPPVPPMPPPSAGWGPSPAPMNVGTAWGAPPPAPRPGVVPLRPLGLGEILDASITYIRRNPRATLGLAAAVAVVNGLIQVVVLGLILSEVPSFTDTSLDADTTSTSTDIAINLVQFLQVGVSLLLQLVATGMLTFVMSQAVLGRGVSAGEAWARVKPLFWRLIGTALLTWFLTGAVVFLAIVPGLLLLLAGSTGPGVALIVIGVLVGVAAAVWVFTVLVLAPPALILERLTVVGALQRSRALVSGSFWRVLGIVILASVLANVISSIITVPFGILAGIGGFVTGADETGVLNWALFGATVGGAVGTVVTLPFSAGVVSLLYIDRRMRREGLDLELVRATSATGGAGSAAPPAVGPTVEHGPPQPGPAQQW